MQKNLSRPNGRLFKDALLAYQMKLHSEHKMTLDTGRRLAKLLDAFGERPIEDIGQAEWTSFVVEKMGGRSPATIQRNMVVMKAILNHAASMGWKINSLRGPRLGKGGHRTTHLKEDEVLAVVNYVRRKYGIAYGFLCLLLCDTGLRFGEAWNLRWCDIGEEWIEVTIGSYSHTKTNPRQIPTSPRLLDYMSKYDIHPPVGRAGGLVNVLDSLMGGSRYTVGKIMGTALKDAVVAVGCMCGPDVRVHDLRHTFAYLCALAGADIADIKELMGHYSIDMTMRYRGFVRPRSARIITEGMRVSTDVPTEARIE